MERKYTLRSDNPLIDRTSVTIRGKCLAEIKCKEDQILRTNGNCKLVPMPKKGVPA